MDILQTVFDGIGRGFTATKDVFAKIENPAVRMTVIVFSVLLLAAFAWKALPWLMLIAIIVVIVVVVKAFVDNEKP